MTVKTILNKIKEDERLAKEKEEARAVEIRKFYEKELQEAVESVKKDLKGLKFNKLDDERWGTAFEVDVGSKKIYVIISQQWYDVQYSDDTSPVEATSIQVSYGYFLNEPLNSVDPKSFAKEFARFLSHLR